ncbi:integral membrane protein [Verticillium alfalfae VaMs.102]|uniref:Integral membrane protein n=1 Tax=Verticillium alfalfae (strain VaMs.102 / ATCC MYA-4576 / FGSC 10136) TaxID=526221 RepID=C9SLZ4_VERA1|nr:integral membrane protein [Verticillium alfalfae VaMs.102]EEY19809.1 integral membrane protein [Verticillium alfalfae VaMs.102]
MATANGSGETNANQVVVPCIVFFALTPIFIIIRLWSRIATRSTIGADDWTIMVSFVCVLVVQILMMFSVSYGFGQHVYELETKDRLMALKLFYVAQIFYKLTINLTKASILALYLRIFVQRWFRICCYVLVSIILAYMVATTASSIFQCSPISGAWDKSSKPTCIDLTKNCPSGRASFPSTRRGR